MTEHVFDEIPALLTGDLDRDTAESVVRHVRGCTDCADELISAAMAHAALTSAARHLPTPMTASPGAHDGDSAVTSTVPSSSLPDLSDVFAQVRREAATAAPRRVARRSGRVRWAAAAAVAGLVLGGGAALLGEHAFSGGPSSRTVPVAAYGKGTVAASAKLTGDDRIRVDASALPALPTGKYYEVWLTNAARTRMSPVGSLGARGSGNFTVRPDLLEGYSAIEVSVQDASGTGAYSGVSVLRGSYR